MPYLSLISTNAAKLSLDANVFPDTSGMDSIAQTWTNARSLILVAPRPLATIHRVVIIANVKAVSPEMVLFAHLPLDQEEQQRRRVEEAVAVVSVS